MIDIYKRLVFSYKFHLLTGKLFLKDGVAWEGVCILKMCCLASVLNSYVILTPYLSIFLKKICNQN